MKKNIALILILTLFSVTAVMAQHHGQNAPKAFRGKGSMCDGRGFGDREPGAGMILKMADELSLSENQKSEIKNLMEKNGLDRIDRKAKLEKAKLKLRHLKLNDASDNEILAAIDQIGELKTEMQKMRFKHRSKMMSILTEDQKDQLEDLKNDFRRNRMAPKPFRGRGLGMSATPDLESAELDYDPPYQADGWGN